MAGSKTNWFEDAVLNVWRNAAVPAVAQPYLALFTVVTDGETSTVTEVAGTNYARTAITFGAPSGGSMANTNLVAFPTPGAGGWGTVVGWGIMDAATVGNMGYYSDQTPNKTINQDDAVEVAIGAITISET